MSILGTGLSGLVGSRIVELNPQYEFIDISLESGFDILNPGSLNKVFQNFTGDTVIHLAAFTDTNSAWEQRGDHNGLCYQLNVVGTQNILDLCQKYKKYLIYFSTDFVFDGTKKGSYLETDTPNPIEWYGHTKCLAEKLIQQSGHPATIIRIAYPYRSHFDAKSDIVRKIITKFQNGENLKMFTDQTTTPTFIDDIALGLQHFFTHQPVGIYHLVGSSSQSPYDLAVLIADIFHLNKNQLQPSSLRDYLVANPPPARPWQINLSLSNHKVYTLGIKTRTITDGLMELKKQLG